MRSKTYEATFEGVGVFPVDMLRYEGAWPKHTDDAVEIAFSIREAERGNKAAHRVTVCKWSRHCGFNLDRWRSFGWTPAIVAGARVMA